MLVRVVWQVLQAIKLLRPGAAVEEQVQSCPHTYCLRMPTRKGYFLQPTAAEAPDPSCYVCSTAMLSLQVSYGAAIDRSIIPADSPT